MKVPCFFLLHTCPDASPPLGQSPPTNPDSSRVQILSKSATDVPSVCCSIHQSQGSTDASHFSITGPSNQGINHENVVPTSSRVEGRPLKGVNEETDTCTENIHEMMNLSQNIENSCIELIGMCRASRPCTTRSRASHRVLQKSIMCTFHISSIQIPCNRTTFSYEDHRTGISLYTQLPKIEILTSIVLFPFCFLLNS